MPTRDQVHDAWDTLGVDNVKIPEYKLSYYKTPTKKDPHHHFEFAWTRIYTLPEVRKRAMYMINRGMVSPNEETHYHRFTNISYWVEVSKSTSKSERLIGIVVKSGNDFYWKGATSGGYHRIYSDGAISSKESDVKLPKSKTAMKRRS